MTEKELMAEDAAEIELEAKSTLIEYAEFLMKTPPSKTVSVTDLWQWDDTSKRLSTPMIKLFCDNDICGGERVFRCREKNWVTINEEKHVFATYSCWSCFKTSKMFALTICANGEGGGTAYKYGEYPVFGPRIPARLLRVIQKDRELFMQGRRCESQGLGIGSFAYYRRVVEDRKNDLLDKLIGVVTKIDSKNDIIAEFEAAKSEKQFTNAIDSVKSAFPQGLLINGENPLKLLHRALSQGIHNHTDKECLSLATSIRVVLTELIDKMDRLVKDDRELTDALKVLTNPPKKSTSGD